MNLQQRLQLELKEFVNLSQNYSFSRMKKDQQDAESETAKTSELALDGVTSRDKE